MAKASLNTRSVEVLVRTSLVAAGAIVCLSAVLATSAGASPVPDPEPGTPEYVQRDLENVALMYGRNRDQATNPDFAARLFPNGAASSVENLADQAERPTRPVISLSQLLPNGRVWDPYRLDWERQGRGLQVPFAYNNRDGARIEGELWAPRTNHVDPVTGKRNPGPYPAVVITTGSIGGVKEMYWWAAQGLAEAGYVVMTYDVQGQGQSEVFPHAPDGSIACDLDGCPGVPFQQEANFVEGTEDALDWFLSARNPLGGLVDASRVGLAGHSLGATAVTKVGNRDPRVDAVVAWDGANLPADQEPRVPTMGHSAEAFFTPASFATAAPDPQAKSRTFQRFRDAGVDAFQLTLRGSTHLEWTYIPYGLPASAEGERVAQHYTLAWFDRYLKGAPGTPTAKRQRDDALRRLTASTFDDSADRSAIGAGVYDPETQQNVPHTIAGQSVADALSVYFTSAYAFDGRTCEDLRRGC